MQICLGPTVILMLSYNDPWDTWLLGLLKSPRCRYCSKVVYRKGVYGWYSLRFDVSTCNQEVRKA
jgi:hypothetical protein